MLVRAEARKLLGPRAWRLFETYGKLMLGSRAGLFVRGVPVEQRLELARQLVAGVHKYRSGHYEASSLRIRDGQLIMVSDDREEPASSHGETMSTAVLATVRSLQLVYLGISGVLHPSATLYKLVRGRSPWSEGHCQYEAVPVLNHALAHWPDARIVLTSTQPWAKGIESVLSLLGPCIAARVIGFTFEDLTLYAKLGPRQSPIGSNDYWRLMKCDIVRLHREWLQPAGWIAIDDETIFWTDDERRTNLVSVDGCKGLLSDTVAQDRLLTLLTVQFGPAA